MRTSLARILFVTSIALVPLAAPAVARAEHPFAGTRPFQLDLHGDLLWYGYGIGGGARFGIPIVHNGFVDSIDDAVYINFGIDTYYVDDFGWMGAGVHHYGFGMGFPITLHWEFYFNDTWSAFGELGFQVYFPASVFDGNPTGYYVDAGAWIIGMVGGTLHFNEVVGLTLRVGNPYVSIGVTLYL